MTTDDRRARDRRTPERRHNVRRQMTVLGWILGLGAATIVLFLLWSLVYS